MKKYLVIFGFLFFNILLFPDPTNLTLRIGINNFPLSLNPVYVTDETSQGIVNKVFDSLFDFDLQGNIKKNLVECYTFLDDGRALLIELKKERFFSDGKKLDADDVLQTYKLLRNPEFGYPYRSAFEFIRKISKLDQFRFKIFFYKKLATWRNVFTFKILNSMEIRMAKPDNFKKRILSGTGPYKIIKVKEPIKVLLSKNRFCEYKSLYPFLEYMVISATHLGPLKLMKEEVDICELQPEDAEVFNHISEWRRKFQILKYKKFGFTYLVFNLNHKRVIKNVRRVFYNKLMVGNFLKRFINKKGERVKTPFLLLDESEKPTRVVTNPFKTRINLKIMVNSESKLRREFVLFLKKELNNSNIFLEPLFLEYHTFLKYIKKGNFDLAVSGFLLDIDYDMKDIFYHDAYFNYANFSNAQMDQLLDEGLKELDLEKRKNIYLQANKIWREELPIIPLFNLYYYMGISKKIRIPDRVCKLMASTGDFLSNIRDWKLR